MWRPRPQSLLKNFNISDQLLVVFVVIAIGQTICDSYTNIFKTNRDYYQFAVKSSQEELLAYNSIPNENYKDYYSILKECQRLVPENTMIQLILPEEQTALLQMLTRKGRYILYPQNYGNNKDRKDFILVYGVANFSVPPNYKILQMFDTDKYLLINMTLRNHGTH